MENDIVTGRWLNILERVILKGELVGGCLFVNALTYDGKCVRILGVILLSWGLAVFIGGFFFL